MDSPKDIRLYNLTVEGCGGDSAGTAVTLEGARVDMEECNISSGDGTLLDTSASNSYYWLNRIADSNNNNMVELQGSVVNFTNNVLQSSDGHGMSVSGDSIWVVNNTVNDSLNL